MAKQSGGTKHKRDKDFLRKPTFEGGSKALRAFISENLNYPQDALDKRIQGDVHLKYDVDEEGNVVTCKVARAIGGGCDEEAMRVVKMLKYSPARNRGAHVTTHHDIVIHFRLPIEHLQPVTQNVLAALPQQVHMSYTYVPASEATRDDVESDVNPTIFTWTVHRHNG